MTPPFSHRPVSQAPPHDVILSSRPTCFSRLPRFVRSVESVAASCAPKNLSMSAASSAVGAPATAPTASAMAVLATGWAVLKSLQVAGSIFVQGWVGGCTSFPFLSLALQSTTEGADAASTISALRAWGRSLVAAMAPGFPLAVVTLALFGPFSSSAFTASARSCATAADSSTLA